VDEGGVADPDTGLYNEAFFVATLDLRVAAGRRLLRPVAVLLLEVTEAPPARVAAVLRELLRGGDVACRLDDGVIGVILEDTTDDGAVWTAERVRRGVAVIDADAVVRGGVASYPSQAFEADVLLGCAQQALAAARDWPKGRIEVAPGSTAT
jgi:GGDEF domain-containing protein